MIKKDIDKVLTGELYNANDSELLKHQYKCLHKLAKYNKTKLFESKKRERILKKSFCEIGDNCFITPPFYANFGCAHCHFGKGVYANYGLTLVDDGEIYVGDYAMFGPNVTIATAEHPFDEKLREKGYQYNLPIKIGKNVWIGAGAIILSGVTIGDNSIIGAGSVVTKNIPSDVIAVGNPCKVLRTITIDDKKYYDKNKLIKEESL